MESTSRRLPDDWWDRTERIAWWCARSRQSDTPGLTRHQRHDAALDGILDYIGEAGWPDREHDLYQAAWRGIAHEAHEQGKHVRHWSHWYEPPGQADALGEAITDKLAIWQAVWSLTDLEWTCVWALGEQIRRGGTWQDAAAWCKMKPGAYRERLAEARRKIRRVWVAPGETPRSHWARGASWRITSNTTMAGRIRNRTRQRARKAAA